MAVFGIFVILDGLLMSALASASLWQGTPFWWYLVAPTFIRMMNIVSLGLGLALIGFDYIISEMGQELEEVDRNPWNLAGNGFAITGTIFSIIGALVNNLVLDHHMAMLLWMVSNPLLFCWSFGNWRGWWDGKLTMGVVSAMYALFAISNAYGLWFQ